MRLIFTAAITFATVTGLLGAYSMLPSKTTDDDFAVHYLRLARNAPDDLQTVIASALPSCLSNGGRSSLEDKSEENIQPEPAAGAHDGGSAAPIASRRQASGRRWGNQGGLYGPGNIIAAVS
jgi:hypothetical protein